LWSSFILQLSTQYDTIEEFNVDSEAECDQLNLTHAARNKKGVKKKLKQTKRQCPLSSVQVKIKMLRDTAL